MIKCGYVAIIGKPSTGKSTLLNALVGKEISITAATPQTTRQSILGIRTTETEQTIYIDTPGMCALRAKSGTKIDRYMNEVARASLFGADVVIWMIDGVKDFAKIENQWLEQLKEVTVPVIIAINKIDKIKNKRMLLPVIEALSTKITAIYQNETVFILPISARRRENLDRLERKIIEYLPEQAFIFAKDCVTDKSLLFQLTEIVRKKIIEATQQELPYVTAVEMEVFKEQDNIVEVGAVIWVERDTQRAILIGHKGACLKNIGTLARTEIECLLGKKVYLRLFVKVKKNWTNDLHLLKSVGYA